MAVAYVNGTTNTGFGSVVVTAPGSIVAGNLLVSVVFCQNVATMGAPSGWTLQGSVSANFMAMAVFTKTATGSEPGSYTFTGANNMDANVLQFSGAVGLDGSPVFNNVSVATTSAVADSVTPTLSTDMWVTSFGSSHSYSFSTPSGLTALVPSGFALQNVFDELLSSSSATGTATSTQSTSSTYTSVSFLLAPTLTASGSGTMVFSGSGTALAGSVASGTGAMVFSGSGAAIANVSTSGTGAMVFSGSGTASAHQLAPLLLLADDIQIGVAFNNLPTDNPASFTWATPGTTGTAGQWTNITAKVYDYSFSNRGKQHDLDQIESGTLTIDADNQDGRFSPWNSSGPYYGLLLPKLWVTVTVKIGSTYYPRFTGHVSAWAPEWGDPFTTQCQITVYDPIRFFNVANLQTAAYANQVITDGVTGFWELAEGTGVVANDSSGSGYNGTYEGTLVYGQTGGLADTPATSVQFGSGTSPVGEVNLPFAAGSSVLAGSAFALEAWINVADLTGQQTILFGINTGFEFYLYVNGGVLSFYQYNSGTGQYLRVTTTTAVIAANIWYYVVYSTTGGLYVNGVLASASFANALVSAPYTTPPSTPTMWIGAYGALGSNPVPAFVGTLQMVAIYQGVTLTATQIANHYAIAVAATLQQTTGARIAAALGVIGWSSGAENVDTGAETVQANPVGNSLAQTSVLSMIQQCVETEGGLFFCQASGVARFVARANLWTVAPFYPSQLTFGDNPTEIHFVAGPTLPLDDVDIYNQATVTPAGGATYIYTNAASVAQYGYLPWTPTATPLFLPTNVISPENRAIWIVNTHANPLTRIDTIVVDMLDVLAMDGVTPGTHTEAVLSLDIGSRVTVNRHTLPAGSAFTQVACIEQIGESVSLGGQGTTGGWQITFTLSATDAILPTTYPNV